MAGDARGVGVAGAGAVAGAGVVAGSSVAVGLWEAADSLVVAGSHGGQLAASMVQQEDSTARADFMAAVASTVEVGSMVPQVASTVAEAVMVAADTGNRLSDTAATI
jgi:hypothetical protein